MARNDNDFPWLSLDDDAIASAVGAASKTAEREEASKRRLASIYDTARKDIQKTLDDARRVLGDAEFTRAMAQERMTPAELYRWSKQMERKHDALVKRCREKGIEYMEQDTEDAARRAKENSARRSITRAKAMLASIDAATAQMAADTQINLSKTLQNEAKKTAKQQAVELNLGYSAEFDAISTAKAKAIANEEFHGGSYTNKIRRNKEKLERELERCIRFGQVNGWSISRMSQEMTKRIGISQREANRLLRTEMTRVSNEAALSQLKSVGAKFYKYIAMLDSRTCDRCRDLHGRVFALSEAKVGKNMPPIHPNCRCRIVISESSQSGEYDTSWVDEIVDRNIEALLTKWAQEDAGVLPEMSLSPEGNNQSRSLLNLPSGAYQTAEESGFEQSVLSMYKAPGVRYHAFKRAYLRSMEERGIPAGIYTMVDHFYTSSVWEDMPPVYVLFDREDNAGFCNYSSRTISLPCTDNPWYIMYVISHELTHMLDGLIWRPRGFRNRAKDINLAFARDARRILSEGITLDGVTYQADILRNAFDTSTLNPEFVRLTQRLLLEVGITGHTPASDIIIRIIYDSLQSVLGVEYGFGHSRDYCERVNGTYVEAVANCGAAYIWGLGNIFSILFPKGYATVKGLLLSHHIHQLRSDNG